MYYLLVFCVIILLENLFGFGCDFLINVCIEEIYQYMMNLYCWIDNYDVLLFIILDYLQWKRFIDIDFWFYCVLEGKFGLIQDFYLVVLDKLIVENKLYDVCVEVYLFKVQVVMDVGVFVFVL